MKKLILTFLVLAAIGAVASAVYLRRGTAEPQITTSPVTRGEIVDAVAATGTVQAVTTVQVGSQVSGTIESLGADFNSIVRKGQVIVKLDPSLFRTQVEQARANLIRSEADRERIKVSLDDANTKYARAKELAARNLLPISELDAAKVAVDAAQAQLQSAQAQVVQSRAALNQAQVNLDHTIIAAPIDGIVTSRNVDVGQTVAASLQSPTLFVIAADLTKMQVNANVDEADVGRIRPGQRAVFRVDAYPAEQFVGEVAQVRLQPVVVQNVTTYGTVINVSNDQLKLKPGMTANVRIQIAQRPDALRVPNTALRFRPSNEVFAALNQPVPPDLQFAGRGGRGGRGRGNGGDGAGPVQTPAVTPAPAGSSPAEGGGDRPAAGRSDAQRTGRGDRQGGDRAGSAGREAQLEGRGRRGGAEDGAGGGDPAARRARLEERLKGLSPEERQQMLDRLKARGVDVTGLEAAAAARTPSGTASKPSAASAQSIDALFAPLPPTESVGRVWIYAAKQLKAVRVRLGITDGTNTELLSDELGPTAEVVTNVVLPGATRPTQAAGAAGNPLLPGGRGPGGFGGGGRGR